MVRVVLRISPLAKAALTASLIGAALALYGRVRDQTVLNGIGSALLFGGALVYVIERFRSRRRPPD